VKTRSWRRNRNRDRIDVKDPEDLNLWAMSLGVTAKQLRDVVEQVGTNAEVVRSYLEGSLDGEKE